MKGYLHIVLARYLHQTSPDWFLIHLQDQTNNGPAWQNNSNKHLLLNVLPFHCVHVISGPFKSKKICVYTNYCNKGMREVKIFNC